MLVLHSDLKLNTSDEDLGALAFSPDGASLIAAGVNCVQVWPRWLDQPPRPVVKVPASLERVAFAPDGKRVYLYMSGNSRTRVLNVATGKTSSSGLPSGGPTWFHFASTGGFALASHNHGKLTRFDYDPKAKTRVRKVWSIDRPCAETDEHDATVLGSHYRFGAICAAAGVFVGQEYKQWSDEPVDGLVTRSVEDGSVRYHKPLDDDNADEMLRYAGLRLTIHPSGTYFAYPQKSKVQFCSISAGVKAPRPLAASPKTVCHAVAFHPSGALLAAVGNNEKVNLYDTTTWTISRTLAWKIGKLCAVCFSADGLHAAAISIGGPKATSKVVVWDVDL